MAINLGLNRVRELVSKTTSLNKANLNVFHVAGTNGKGSVCNYIESVLLNADLSTLKFNSPHLITPNDAIQYKGNPIELPMYTDLLNYIKNKNDLLKINATEFEIQTALAFKCYELLTPDYAIFEVGLGGRLDATNILSPKDVICSVLTHISVDHEHFLGSDLKSIAFEKGGIIKPNVPCAADGSNPEIVTNVLQTIAESNNAPFSKTLGSKSVTESNKQLAELALISAKNLDLNENQIKSGLEKAKIWPGRLQFINDRLLVDGAHNPAAAYKLRETVDQIVDQHNQAQTQTPLQIRWVMAFSKPAEKIMEILVKPNDFVIVLEFDNVEGMPWIKPQPARDLMHIASKLTSPKKVSNFNLEKLPEFDGLTVICGSLYLVGQYLQKFT